MTTYTGYATAYSETYTKNKLLVTATASFTASSNVSEAEAFRLAQEGALYLVQIYVKVVNAAQQAITYSFSLSTGTSYVETFTNTNVTFGVATITNSTNSSTIQMQTSASTPQISALSSVALIRIA